MLICTMYDFVNYELQQINVLLLLINVQLAFKISEVCSSILSMQFNVASLGFGRASEMCKSKCNKLPYVLDFIVKNKFGVLSKSNSIPNDVNVLVQLC